MYSATGLPSVAPFHLGRGEERTLLSHALPYNPHTNTSDDKEKIVSLAGASAVTPRADLLCMEYCGE